MHKIRRSLANVAVVLSVLAFINGNTALAQEAAREAVAPSCAVFPSKELDGQLVAACKVKGFILGHADSYGIIGNPGLEATIIDITRGGERRVLMISFPDGVPLLEDISGTLAKAAGRGPMSGLKGLEIDFSNFGEESRIAVRTSLEEGGGASRAAEVNLGQDIALEAVRRADAQARN